MQESMTELSRENLGMGLPELGMGIGINCGQLVVGNIGSEKRKKYGAVGNPINEAFRVEGNTRPGEILVTQSVKDKLGDKLQIGSCWRVNLKGMGNTPIYQVIGMKEN
jgi:sigma-B regulation protein RsbU (phosphoserine phosphatase)